MLPPPGALVWLLLLGRRCMTIAAEPLRVFLPLFLLLHRRRLLLLRLLSHLRLLLLPLPLPRSPFLGAPLALLHLERLAVALLPVTGQRCFKALLHTAKLHNHFSAKWTTAE